MTTTGERLAGGERMNGLVVGAPRDEVVERTLQYSLQRMMESVRPEGIFGSVVEREGVAIIPCAEVSAGFGMGGGRGFGPALPNRTPSATGAEAAGAQPGPAGGSGAGGGGGATGRPVAVIVISEGKLRVQPVVDVTKLALAALTAFGFSAFLVSQMFAPRGGRGRWLGSAVTPARLVRALRR